MALHPDVRAFIELLYSRDVEYIVVGAHAMRIMATRATRPISSAWKGEKAKGPGTGVRRFESIPLGSFGERAGSSASIPSLRENRPREASRDRFKPYR